MWYHIAMIKKATWPGVKAKPAYTPLNPLLQVKKTKPKAVLIEVKKTKKPVSQREQMRKTLKRNNPSNGLGVSY